MFFGFCRGLRFFLWLCHPSGSCFCFCCFCWFGFCFLFLVKRNVFFVYPRWFAPLPQLAVFGRASVLCGFHGHFIDGCFQLTHPEPPDGATATHQTTRASVSYIVVAPALLTNNRKWISPRCQRISPALKAAIWEVLVLVFRVLVCNRQPPVFDFESSNKDDWALVISGGKAIPPQLRSLKNCFSKWSFSHFDCGACGALCQTTFKAILLITASLTGSSLFGRMLSINQKVYPILANGKNSSRSFGSFPKTKNFIVTCAKWKKSRHPYLPLQKWELTRFKPGLTEVLCRQSKPLFRDAATTTKCSWNFSSFSLVFFWKKNSEVTLHCTESSNFYSIDSR